MKLVKSEAKLKAINPGQGEDICLDRMFMVNLTDHQSVYELEGA